MKKIFVDGQEGTTGLKIHEYLSKRTDIEILKIDPEKRKDPVERAKYLNESDISFLCLPDEGSRESVSLVKNNNTCIIDASTAFRTNPEWTYGLPEMNKNQRERISKSKRICVPGCHATGFISIVYPLVSSGIINPDYPLVCSSITGYSGGGKKLIAKFEDIEKDKDYTNTPRHYALLANHKHLPEMKSITGLAHYPAFTPIIGNFYKGMVVNVCLFPRLMNKKMNTADIREFYKEYYDGEMFIDVKPFADEKILKDGFLDPIECNGTNRLEFAVYGNDEQIKIMTRFDNLGKGASGAAVQNMNIVLGSPEDTGLVR